VKALVPVLVLGLLGAAACQHVDRSGPAGPTQAALDIQVAPDPLRALWVCPPGDARCYGSLDATVTIIETAGLGGRLDAIEFVLRDRVAGVAVGTLNLTPADIASRAGSDRLQAMGRLAVRPIIEGYPVPADMPRPQLEVQVAAQLTDDRGNVVRHARTVPVT
jgi:hypothetical protein